MKNIEENWTEGRKEYEEEALNFGSLGISETGSSGEQLSVRSPSVVFESVLQIRYAQWLSQMCRGVND